MDPIALGDIAKDTLTGFEGVVVGRTHWLTNCDRLTLQPQSLDKDGQPQKTNSFDITHCALVKSNAVQGGPRDWDRRAHLELGDTVRDEITGFEGVVTARSTWLSANDTLVIQPKALGSDGQPQKSHAFEASTLTLVAKLNPPAPKTDRGGPCGDVQRRADPEHP